MNTKYHIFTNSSSNNRVIAWDNVAGNDFGSQNITDGAFITTVENRSGYLPHIIYFNLNVVSDTPFLQIRVPAELGTRSGHDLVFHFSDETTHVMESEAAWDGSDVLYILTYADLKALAEKEIDHYCFHGLARSLNGDMSSALKLSSLRMNQYDKETGARLFREYVCDFIQILKEEFGIELQTLASKEPSSQEEKPSEEKHTEVFAFKGIPISGQLDDMVESLEGVGFTHAFSEDDKAILTGSFAFDDDCMIVVSSDPVTGEVESILMGGEQTSSWPVLKDKYFRYKKALTKKYGEPKSLEAFQGPYYDGCGVETLAIELGDCVYMSTFTVGDQGEIKLAITETRIAITYTLGIPEPEDDEDRWDSAMDDL